MVKICPVIFTQETELVFVLHVPVIQMIMAAKCRQQTCRIEQCSHEWHITTVVIGRILLGNRLAVDPWFPARTDTIFAEGTRCIHRDVEECKRWDGFLIMIGKVGVLLSEPCCNLCRF